MVFIILLGVGLVCKVQLWFIKIVSFSALWHFRHSGRYVYTVLRLLTSPILVSVGRLSSLPVIARAMIDDLLISHSGYVY